jgi:hypothetical protein
MAADTSSAAAATTPVVGVAAAALAALSVEAIAAKFEDADSRVAGTAKTNDIGCLPIRHGKLVTRRATYLG